MTRPVLPFDVTALDRLYDRLPEHYRESDEATGFPLYRWLGGIMSQHGELEQLIVAIDYVPPAAGAADTDTSTLTDPTVAPVEWLPWLAQLVGVPLRPEMSEAEKRDAIRFASAGWRAGTKAAVADAVRSELIGTQYAKVYDHSVTDPGDGGEWDVLIITRNSETPDPTAVLEAAARRGVKPAGVLLHHRTYESSWDAIEAAAPTWADIEALGSWEAIEEVGLS